jgi:hypothetical protein
MELAVLARRVRLLVELLMQGPECPVGLLVLLAEFSMEAFMLQAVVR